MLASCVDDGTGPGELRRAHFALAPVFDRTALLLVPVDRVHIVLRHADNAIALDTTVLFPASEDTLSLALDVNIQGSTEQLDLTLFMLDLQGTVVFQAGPVPVTATAGASSPPPVTPPFIYVGTGANAVGVRFVANPNAVFFGDTVLFVAEAFDQANAAVANTPIAFSVADTNRARVPDAAVGRVVGKTTRGPTSVTASLLRTSRTVPPPSVNTPLQVQPRPNAILVQGGNNQSGPVGGVLSQPVTARVQAADNLGVQGVLVTFAVTSGAGNLSSATATTNASGDASVTWTLGPGTGSQGVTATAAGVTGSAVFGATATGGTPTRVTFVAQPPPATAGASMVPAIQVAVQDVNGNTITTAAGTVTLAILANPGGGTLGGVVTTNVVAGIATFGAVNIDRSGSGYTLRATSAGLASDTSAAFNVTAATATSLTFSTQPPTIAGQGAPFTVVVTARDGFSNVATGFTGTVTVAIGTNPAGGTLSGTTGVAAVAGVALFNTLAIDNVGSGYTLTASATGVSGSTSNAFAVALNPSIKQWTNAAGGNWSNAANWSGGTVPSPADTVAIVVGGTYTVVLDTSYSGQSLILGGATGSQTLVLAGRPLIVTGPILVGATGVFNVSSGTLGGTGSLVNQGTTVLTSSTSSVMVANQGLLRIQGSVPLNGGLVTLPGSTLRIEGNGTQGNGILTVAGGFANLGAIELTSVGSGFPAQLIVTGGTLLNSPTGTITALPGVGGGRTLTADLDNQGLLTVDAPLTMDAGSADHSNSGTINVSGADLAIAQSGTTPSFTNTGTITVGAARTWTVTGGALDQNAGTVGGPGTFSLVSVTAAFTTNLTNATTSLGISNSTINGPGTLTNAAGRTLFVTSSTINAALDNQGLLLVAGSVGLNGGLTTATGSTLRIEGNGSQGNGILTVAAGFTNTSVIELTSAGSGFPSQLIVTGGTLVNAPAGTITTLVGAGGARSLTAQLNNQGLLSVNAPLLMDAVSAAHNNSGTIDVNLADLSLVQSGTTPAFNNAGTITLGAGRTWAITGGSLNQNAGTIGGPGALSLVSVAAAFTTSFTNTTTSLSLVNSTFNGPGTLTNDAGRTMLLTSSTINAAINNLGLLRVAGSTAFNGTLTTTPGSMLSVEGNGSQGNGILTVAAAFTNNAAIELTSVGSGFPSQLIVTSGVLTNAAGGTITALAGAGGARTLTAQLNNGGLLTVDAPLTINAANAGHANGGTIAVSGADLALTQSGPAGSLLNNGTVNIGAGRTWSINGGELNQTAGTILGSGTLSLTSVTVGFQTNLADAPLSLAITSSTINGPAALAIAGSQTLVLVSSTVTTALDNQGLLRVAGTVNVAGALTTSAGSTLRVEGNGSQGNGSLTVANGFTNIGTIELTSVGSGFPSQLIVTTGTVVNTSTGVIASLPGAGGGRTFTAPLNNQGLLAVSQSLTVTGAFASTGTMNVLGGTLSLNTGGSFSGTSSAAAGAFLQLSSGDWGIGADWTHNGDFVVENAAFEHFNDHTATINGNMTVQGNTGRVDMTGASDVLVVSGNLAFNGSGVGTLNNGTILLSGNFSQGGPNAGAYRGTGSHQLVFNGIGPHTVTFASPGGGSSSHFGGVAFQSGGSYVLGSDVFTTGSLFVGSTITGPHRLTVGGGMVFASGPTLGVRSLEFNGGAGISNDGITYAVDTTVITGGDITPPVLTYNHVVAAGDMSWGGAPIAGSLIVTGTFAPGGTPVTVGGEFITSGPGVLRIESGEQLNVTGNATFSGGDETGLLTSGTLTVGGNFAQVGAANTFTAETAFTVELAGTGLQTIGIAAPGLAASRFGTLRLANRSAAGISLLSDVAAQTLEVPSGAPSPLVTSTNQLITATDFNVTGLTLSNTRLALFADTSSAPITALDNVTFQGMSAGATQLSLTKLGGVHVFNGLVFDQTPATRVYVSLTGTGANPNFSLLTPTPLADPGAAFYPATGGTINWGFQP